MLIGNGERSDTVCVLSIILYIVRAGEVVHVQNARVKSETT